MPIKSRDPEDITREEKAKIQQAVKVIETMLEEAHVPTDYRIDIYASLLVDTLVKQRLEDEIRGRSVDPNKQQKEPLFPLNVQLLIDTFTGMRETPNATQMAMMLIERNKGTKGPH